MPPMAPTARLAAPYRIETIKPSLSARPAPPRAARQQPDADGVAPDRRRQDLTEKLADEAVTQRHRQRQLGTADRDDLPPSQRRSIATHSMNRMKAIQRQSSPPSRCPTLSRSTRRSDR